MSAPDNATAWDVLGLLEPVLAALDDPGRSLVLQQLVMGTIWGTDPELTLWDALASVADAPHPWGSAGRQHRPRPRVVWS